MEKKEMIKAFLDNFPNSGIFVLQEKKVVQPSVKNKVY
jgi:predicted ATP-grasp superfamily ATP-dependent carboligase